MSKQKLEWRDGTPVSSHFGDIYYNPADPLGESRHVFLQGIDLDAQIQTHQYLRIGETGFGTGLNFLLTWQRWQALSKPGQWLRYHAIEGFPLSSNDLKKALQPFDELTLLSTELLQQYPHADAGFHLLSWPESRVELLLLFMPVEQALSALCARMHCWYLDGFAPARNPEMWNETVLDGVARLSEPGCKLATFTAAGFVRRGLEQRGFAMRKQPGFGRKRDMLAGCMQHTGPPLLPNWMQTESSPVQKAIVVGAGIAGAQVAWHLQQRGIEVTVLEAEKDVATQGSGNPRGLLSPALHADGNTASQFYRQSYQYAWRQIQTLQAQGHAIDAQQNGVYRLLRPTETERFQQALQNNGLSPETACMEAITLPDEQQQCALHLKDTGWVNPRQWIKALLHRLEVRTGFKVHSLQPHQDQWRLTSHNGESLQAELVILTQGIHLLQWPFSQWLPLRARPGHLLYWPANEASKNIQQALTGLHYLLPEQESKLILGSSFEHLPRSAWLLPLQTDHRQMEKLAERIVEDWSWLGKAPKTLQGRRGMRAATPDHLPLCGPLPDEPQWQDWLQPYRKGMPLKRLRGAPKNMTGLYALSGMGARGLASAPLAAQLLTDWICSSENFTLPFASVRALHPARFLLRKPA